MQDPVKVKKITLRDFYRLHIGYKNRCEKEINLSRNIMTAVMNAQGRIYQNPITPEQIWQLDMDKKNEKKMITTMAQAMKLLKEYLKD